ncbi:hypothetical protein CDAR_556221, partial [Caerostris darwini]
MANAIWPKSPGKAKKEWKLKRRKEKKSNQYPSDVAVENSQFSVGNAADESKVFSFFSLNKRNARFSCRRKKARTTKEMWPQ